MERREVILLALVLSWLPVTQDCHGGPESVSHYLVRTFEARVIGTVTQPDGTEAPEYLRTLTIYRAEHSGGGSCFGRPYPCLTLPDPVAPALGEVLLLEEPVAVDYSGNRSDAPCL
jgi:hypothetical protein